MGKWLKVDGEVFMCSDCKEQITFWGVDPKHIVECPLCGAEMKTNEVPNMHTANYVWRCRKCDRAQYAYKREELSDSCPYCGAKMEAKNG